MVIIMKIYIRKFISVLLALTMLIGVVPLSAFAEAEPQHLDGASISDEVLNSNVFYIGSTNITMSERSNTDYLLKIGRGGDAENEASVTVKFADMSAVYGKNYEVKTYDGEKPEVDSEGKSVADLMAENADTAEEYQYEDDETLAKEADELMANADSVSVLNADGEEVAKLKTPDGEEAEDPTEKESAKEPEAEQSGAENEEEAQGADEELNETNPLKAARNTYTGTVSDRQPMTVTTSDGKQFSAEEDPGELIGDDFPGVEFRLTFASGEKEKFIVITPKYSKKSDGDAMFLVSLQNPDGDYGIAEEYNSIYGTIIDEDAPETIKVGFAESTYRAKDGKVYIEVTREGAINDMACVTIYTENGTAESGADFSGVNAKLYFPMGIMKRTVEIPVEHYAKDIDFTVKLALPQACEITNDTASVIIPAWGSDEVTLAASKDDPYPDTGIASSLDLSRAQRYGTAQYKGSDGIYIWTSKAKYDEECGIKLDFYDCPFYYDGVRVDWEADSTTLSFGNIRMYSDYTKILDLRNKNFDRCEQNFYFGYVWTNQLNMSIVQTAWGARELYIHSVYPIKRKFDISLMPAEGMSFKGVSDAEAAEYVSCSLDKDFGAKTISSGDGITVSANNNYAYLKAVEVVKDGRSMVLAENKSADNSLYIRFDKAMINKLAEDQFIEWKSDGKKGQNEQTSYKGKISLRPIFEYRDVTLKVVDTPEGEIEGLETPDGVDKEFKYHLGDRVNIKTVMSPEYANMLATGFRCEYRREENGELIEDESSHYIGGSSEKVLELKEPTYTHITLTPEFSARDNCIRISVDKKLVDSGKFDTTKGIFAAPKEENPATGCYEYVIDKGDIKTGAVYSLTAIPTDSSDAVTWKEAGNDTIYSGNNFYFIANATARRNNVTLSIDSTGKREAFAVQGYVYNADVNIKSGIISNSRKIPAVTALITVCGADTFTDSEGYFCTNPFMAVPETSARYMVTYNGRTKLETVNFSAEGAEKTTIPGTKTDAVVVDMGMINAPTYSARGVRVNKVLVSQNDYLLNGSGSVIPLEGGKIKLHAIVTDGEKYTYGDKEYTESIIGVTFHILDGRTYQLKSSYEAEKEDEVTWGYEFRDFSPNSPDEYTYGDVVYVSLTTDKILSDDEEATEAAKKITYAPVSADLRIINGKEYTPKMMDLHVPVSPDDLLNDDYEMPDLSDGNKESADEASLMGGTVKKRSFAKFPFVGEISANIGIRAGMKPYTSGGVVPSEHEVPRIDDEGSYIYDDDGNIMTDTETVDRVEDPKGGQDPGKWNRFVSVSFERLPTGGTRVKIGMTLAAGEKYNSRMDHKNAITSSGMANLFGGKFKQSYEKASKGELLQQTLGGAAMFVTIKFGAYMDFGYITEEYTDGHDEKAFFFMGAGVYVGGYLGLDVIGYGAIPVIMLPMFYGCTGMLGAEGEVGIEADPLKLLTYGGFLDSEEVSFGRDFRNLHAQLDGVLMIRFYLGAGIANALALRGTGTFNFGLGVNSTLRFFEGSPIWGATGNFTVGGQADILWLSIPFDIYSWNLFNFGFYDYFKKHPEVFEVEYEQEEDSQEAKLASSDGLSYSYIKRTGGSDWVADENASLQGAFAPVNTQTLATNVFKNSDGKLISIGENKMLYVFLDDNPSKAENEITSLMYSIYVNGAWSEPKVVQDDSTGDFYPNVCDAGDSVMVSWVSSDPAKSENLTEAQRMQQMEVYTVLFNKESESLGEIEQLTDDNYFDSNPIGIYDSISGDRAVYYIKNSTQSDNVFDYANPFGSDTNDNYSVVCYMLYDGDSGKWVRDRYFDNELENPEDADTLIENWGGQRFLPSVTKTETGGQVDPTVTDLVACEGYNGLGVYAYTVDTDFNLETNNDRELYIQVYDFETHKTYKPIRVTNDSVSQSLPQLVRVPNKDFAEFDAENEDYKSGASTYLFWMEGDCGISYINVTELIREGINDDGTLKFGSGIAPQECDLHTEDGRIGGVNTYKAVVDADGNLYLVWAKPVGENIGVDEEGNSTGMLYQEIYASALIADKDIDEHVKAEKNDKDPEAETTVIKPAANWSKPYRLTYSEVCNDTVSAAVRGDGKLMIVNNQFTMEYDENKEGNINIGEMNIVSTELEPIGTMSTSEITFSDSTPLAGDEITVYANFENTGLTAAAGYTAKFYESRNGEKGKLIGEYDSDSYLVANTSEDYSFTYTVPENFGGLSILCETAEKGYTNTETYVSEPFKKTAEYKVAVKGVEQVGNGFEAVYTVTNTGNAVSENGDVVKFTFDALYGDAKEMYGVDDINLASESLGGIAPGESKQFTTAMTVPTSAFEYCGYAGLRIAVFDKDGKDLTGGYNTYLVQDKPINVKLNGGKTITVKKGGKTALELNYDDVQMYNYNGKSVSEDDKVFYNVADTSIAEIRDGQLVGKKVGTTTVTASIQPYGTIVTADVNVTSSGGSHKGSSSSKPTSTPEPTTTPEPTANPSASINAADRFTDIAPTDWFCEAVSIVLDKGIVSGTSDTTFEPDATLTRAMLATMLYRYAGEPTVNYAMNYTDTEDGWYTEAVRWASSIGVVKGFDDNTFRPDEPITREQAAAMLQRYAEFAKESNSLWNETNILSYEDFDSISDWAIPSLQWAAGAGVMKGRTDSTINPIENITRAEIAQMLVNYMGAVENYKNEINKED